MLRRIAEHYTALLYIFDLDKSSFSSDSAIFSGIIYNLIQILLGYRQAVKAQVFDICIISSNLISPVCLYHRQRLFVSFLYLFSRIARFDPERVVRYDSVGRF